MGYAESYSCNIVTGILDKLNIDYTTHTWHNSLAEVCVIAVFPSGGTLSINTHPDAVNWAFCETAGEFTLSPRRHRTPELFEQYIVRVIQKLNQRSTSNVLHDVE